jgi:tetratricopeptide (TPR) repeat protein
MHDADDSKRADAKAAKPKAAGRVIHVQFGRGGGRVAPPPEATLVRGAHVEPAQIVVPSAERDGKRAYTFSDLIALRATSDLLAKRVRIGEVARAIAALRKTLPRVTRPLQELRIVSDGKRVIVRAEGSAFEPVTGQLVLDFRVDHLTRDVVRVLRPETEDARRRTAYDCYLRASAKDEDPATFDDAENLYRRAVELDPFLAIAYTNLGNLRFRRGDEAQAEALYRHALSMDARQPEAHYNLGYVMLERGRYAAAIDHLQRAVEADARFADAHFNLAMAYESSMDAVRARRHWQRYLELEPSGAWADVAREHLV